MTFLETWERVRKLKESADEAAISAIFTGTNVSQDFWENFILVCNNKDGLSALLGVTPDKVAAWPHSIQKYLDESKSRNNPEEKEKSHIINTGDKEV
jgi:hypothetical protein